MAIARTSSLIGAISGSVGAVTFANTRQGLVVKQRPQKINQRTDRQLHARAAFLRTVKHWRQLPHTARMQYANVAANTPHTNRLGVTSRLSPFQFFLHKQVMTAFWGYPYWTGPPPAAHVLTVDASTFTFTQGGPFTILLEISPILRYAVTKVCRPFSSTPKISPKTFLTLGRYEFTMFESYNIYPEFVGRLGDPQAGESITIQIVISSRLWATSYYPPLTYTTTILPP